MPSPDQLPKEWWEPVLARMGARLGKSSEYFEPYHRLSMEEVHSIQSENIYPEEELLSDSAWARLQQYFLENAPDSFQLSASSQWETNSIFEMSFPELNLPGFPAISMVEFDEVSNKIYIADWNGYLVRLNADLTMDEFQQVPKPIVDIINDGDGNIHILSIGQLYPNDRKLGVLGLMNEQDFNRPDFQFSDLARPVHFAFADLNTDSLKDYVVCQFGNLVGQFSWFENQGNGQFKENEIKKVPGATVVIPEDLDQDGDQDLITLFGQGDEGVSFFYNEGTEFIERKVLRTPSVYGSNDMEYLDIDQDGIKDLIVTNGDNGDQTNTLKPYHGVRIYTDDGNRNFTERYFFPFYGASKVRTSDFDLDGDPDLLVMSFFPDSKNNPDQSLVYLRNEGDWNFTPFEIPGASKGRWMVMDAGDVDDDGDDDVLIGSFALSSAGFTPDLVESWRQGGIHLMYLENKTR